MQRKLDKSKTGCVRLLLRLPVHTRVIVASTLKLGGTFQNYENSLGPTSQKSIV